MCTFKKSVSVLPVVEAGGEFSRERGGSESMREPRGVPESDSRDGVGEPTDILLTPLLHTTCQQHQHRKQNRIYTTLSTIIDYRVKVEVGIHITQYIHVIFV